MLVKRPPGPYMLLIHVDNFLISVNQQEAKCINSRDKLLTLERSLLIIDNGYIVITILFKSGECRVLLYRRAAAQRAYQFSSSSSS